MSNLMAAIRDMKPKFRHWTKVIGTLCPDLTLHDGLSSTSAAKLGQDHRTVENWSDRRKPRMHHDEHAARKPTSKSHEISTLVTPQSVCRKPERGVGMHAQQQATSGLQRSIWALNGVSNSIVPRILADRKISIHRQRELRVTVRVQRDGVATDGGAGDIANTSGLFTIPRIPRSPRYR